MYKKLLVIILLSSAFLLIGLNGVNGNEKINIVALGDSITYGVGDPLKQGYILRLVDLYENKKGIEVQISNYGIPRYRTSDVLKQLNTWVVREKIMHADYLTLFIGTNDLRKSANYEFNKINEEKITLGKENFTKNLIEILSTIKSLNPDITIITLGIYNPYNDDFGHVIADWNAAIQAITESFQKTAFVPTVDLVSNRKYYSDSLHPNPEGYNLISKRLFKTIITLEEEQ